MGARGAFSVTPAPAIPARDDAPCPHFPACGGCALQHLSAADIDARKTRFAADALTRAGGDPGVLAPLVRTPPCSRRRMDFAIRRTAAGIALGLHPPRSHDVTDLHTCLVLHPTLFALLAPLRPVLTRLQSLRRNASLVANLLDTGPDLLLRLDAAPSAADRTALAAFAAAHAIPRIATASPGQAPEPAVQLSRPCHHFAGHAVTPPPGAFLQASREGEAAITAAVLAGLPEHPRAIVELYAGIGTLSFPLAARARVTAYEGDPAAHAALRQAGAGTRIHAQLRDLARQPLQPREFARADAVVLDPPHAGAAAQMAAVAAARVPRVVYVTCNPNTFARDAAVLVSGGYTLLRAAPIDQFLWSERLEMVAVFAMEERKKDVLF